MATVKFIMDYRGVLTGERYFVAGVETELDDSSAKALELRGYVEILGQEPTSKTTVSKRGKK
jgi:hypothetical protein